MTRFLRNNGWEKVDFPNEKLLRFRSPESQRDDDGKPIFLMIPCGTGFIDGLSRMTSAVEALAAIYQQSFENMIYWIKNQSSDIFDQRIFGMEGLSSISLEAVPEVLKKLRDLVYYSACAEEEPLQYFERGRKIGKEYTKKCRFAHTFPGSFGLRIEMPLPPNEFLQGLEVEPMERRIMKRIFSGLQFAARGVNEGDVGIITQNYGSAFNANLCEVMADLTSLLPDLQLGYRLNWSSEYKIAPSFICKDEIHFPTNEYRQFFESAARSLRKSGESQQTEVRGKIIQLHAETETETDAEMTTPVFSDRFIIIEWEREGEQKRKIKVALSREDYLKACDAHKNGQTVRVNGIPEKTGQILTLTRPSQFAIM